MDCQVDGPEAAWLIKPTNFMQFVLFWLMRIILVPNRVHKSNTMNFPRNIWSMYQCITNSSLTWQPCTSLSPHKLLVVWKGFLLRHWETRWTWTNWTVFTVGCYQHKAAQVGEDWKILDTMCHTHNVSRNLSGMKMLHAIMMKLYNG